MQYTHFMDKYPTHHLNILKSETKYTSVDDIISFFRSKVDTDPRACCSRHAKAVNETHLYARYPAW